MFSCGRPGWVVGEFVLLFSFGFGFYLSLPQPRMTRFIRLLTNFDDTTWLIGEGGTHELGGVGWLDYSDSMIAEPVQQLTILHCCWMFGVWFAVIALFFWMGIAGIERKCLAAN
jgi:hypothetical protein